MTLPSPQGTDSLQIQALVSGTAVTSQGDPGQGGPSCSPFRLSGPLGLGRHTSFQKLQPVLDLEVT